MSALGRVLAPGPVIAGRRLPSLPVAAAIVALVVANAWFTYWTVRDLVLTPAAFDWEVLVESGRRVRAGGLYDHEPTYLFVWSPLAAWVMSVLGIIGTGLWRVAHFAVLALLPDRRLAMLVAASWPFWVDVEAGNILVFVFVAAVWALRGSWIGTLAFVALSLLAPRPLQIPVVAWILWRRPAWRWPFAAMFAIHAVLVLASGWGGEWVSTVLGSSRELANDTNVGPSQWIGAAWIPIGLMLGGWLFLRGRLGLASLAVSPYWLPMYLIMGFLELDRRPARGGTQADAS